MIQPLISIIIPNYNRANLIGETLDSILTQTYTNWECIIVDDGSADKSKEVIQAYVKKDNRFQLHNRPKNRPKGANACRNYGFELSNGEYINWFDSDDLMLPKKLEIQIKELHSSIYDYTICQTMKFDIEPNKEMGLKASIQKSNKTFEDYILFKIFWLTGAPLWKRSFLEQNKLSFDEELQQSQDYDFHIKVLDISDNYLSIDNPLVVFRYHENNMSNSTFDRIDKIYSNLKVRNEILVSYNNKLSPKTRIFVYNQILYIFKRALINKRLKLSLLVLIQLLKRLDAFNLSFMKKLKIALQLIASFFSFHLLSKGAILLDLNILEGE